MSAFKEPKGEKVNVRASFCDFLDDPVISLSLTAFGLIALMFTIMEFTQTVRY